MNARRWVGAATTMLLLGGAIVGGAFLGRQMSAVGQTAASISPDPTLLAEYIPQQVETATFSLGCFWGPDAMFGSLPGVLRTRVGYAGGTTADPTYYDIGDHAEAIEIDFDPSVISYRRLLEVFWSGHDPYEASYDSRFRSIIFAHDEAQKETAMEFVAEKVGESGHDSVTTITEFVSFTRAEAYQQKHDLWMVLSVMEEVLPGFASYDEFVDSTLVARLNGLLSGWGSANLAQETIEQLRLSDASVARILDCVKAGPQPTCGVLVDPALQQAHMGATPTSDEATVGVDRLGS